MNAAWKYVVYLITNMVTGKQYAGITSRGTGWRMTRHVVDSRIAENAHKPMCRAINKYGREAFYIEELCRCETWESACSVEQTIISERRTRSPHGYNLTDGGEGVVGFVWKPEAIERMRMALTGRKRSLDAIRRTAEAHRGMKRSPEVCQKMRQRVMSEATRDKIRSSVTAYNNLNPTSRERLERMWAASRASPITQEGKRRISAANSHPRSETSRMFMRMGRKFAKDQRMTMSLPAQQGTEWSCAIMGFGP